MDVSLAHLTDANTLSKSVASYRKAEGAQEAPFFQRENTSSDALAQESLSADIRLLDDLLGAAIRRLAGKDAFAMQEEIRAVAGAVAVADGF